MKKRLVLTIVCYPKSAPNSCFLTQLAPRHDFHCQGRPFEGALWAVLSKLTLPSNRSQLAKPTRSFFMSLYQENSDYRKLFGRNNIGICFFQVATKTFFWVDHQRIPWYLRIPLRPPLFSYPVTGSTDQAQSGDLRGQFSIIPQLVLVFCVPNR